MRLFRKLKVEGHLASAGAWGGEEGVDCRRREEGEAAAAPAAAAPPWRLRRRACAGDAATRQQYRWLRLLLQPLLPSPALTKAVWPSSNSSSSRRRKARRRRMAARRQELRSGGRCLGDQASAGARAGAPRLLPCMFAGGEPAPFV